MKRPVPTDSSPVYAPYFAGLREGRIAVQRCGSCGTTHWPPREMCGSCHSEDIGWFDAPLEGEVYTFTVSYRAFHPAFVDRVPYAVTTVQLGDVKVFGEFDGDPESLRIGDRVRASFFPVDDDVSLLRWVPTTQTHDSEENR